jgi:dTDP-4-dehydrorhamnose reductase
MKVLLTGASGQLGSYLLRELKRGGLPFVAWSGSRSGEHHGVPLLSCDLCFPDRVAVAFRQVQPTVVLHAGAIASIADCQRDPDRARRVNTEGSAVLAELADRARARMLLVSTDLVFDGERGSYREEDPPAPLSIYARTKVAAEQAVLGFPRNVVVRCSLLLGPSLNGRPGFFDQQVADIRERKPLPLFADEWRTPLGMTTAARALLALAWSDFAGLLHVGGPERMSRLEMGQRLAGLLGSDASMIVATERASMSGAEWRPRDVSLDSTRWLGLFPDVPWPRWDQSLHELGVS